MTRSLVRSSVVVALLAMLFLGSPSLSVFAQRGGGGSGGARGGGGGAGAAGPARPSSPGPARGTATVRPGPGGPGAPRGSVVVAGGYPYRYGYGYGYGYPYRYCCGYPYGWYSPWYGAWGWNIGLGFGWGYPYSYGGYPYAYGYPYGYPYGSPYSNQAYGFYSASLKLEVTPKTAEVFVDGYRAGIVDDFDGTFQRLDLPPGEHELVLYAGGYRTVQQKLFMSASSSQRVKYALEKNGPGEMTGPRPTPAPEPAAAPQQYQLQQPQPRPRPQQPPDPAQAPESFGMISIRTQPVDAEILVDGEAWERSTGMSRLVIQLTPGRHRVEVRKAGFTAYSEEVLIRAGATMTLNVSLLRGEER